MLSAQQACPPPVIMDPPSALYVDARRGRITHVGGDQLNLSIHIPRTPSAAPSSMMPSTALSYPWKVLSGLYNYVFLMVFHHCGALVGQRTHYVVWILVDNATRT